MWKESLEILVSLLLFVLFLNGIPNFSLDPLLAFLVVLSTRENELYRIVWHSRKVYEHFWNELCHTFDRAHAISKTVGVKYDDRNDAGGRSSGLVNGFLACNALLLASIFFDTGSVNTELQFFPVTIWNLDWCHKGCARLGVRTRH